MIDESCSNTGWTSAYKFRDWDCTGWSGFRFAFHLFVGFLVRVHLRLLSTSTGVLVVFPSVINDGLGF